MSGVCDNGSCAWCQLPRSTSSRTPSVTDPVLGPAFVWGSCLLVLVTGALGSLGTATLGGVLRVMASVAEVAEVALEELQVALEDRQVALKEPQVVLMER
jgi:hypothetical protein